MSGHQLALQLFLQLLVILAVCRAAGWLGRRWLGQPQVVMEMVAGVVLGPSVLGALAPELQARLFPRQLDLAGVEGLAAGLPHPSMQILYAIAQLGLVLYMLVVGLELDLGQLAGRTASTAGISAAGIAAPLALGLPLAAVLYGDPEGRFFTPDVSFLSSFLFVGASIAITAFPMLARIIHERGLTGTRIGSLTLTAGAVNDAAAWCLLAIVLATLEGSPQRALETIGGGFLFALGMVVVVRPLLGRLLRRPRVEDPVTPGVLSTVLLALLASAWITDQIGVYAVFGAFLLGTVLPAERALAAALRDRIERLTTTLLVPVFFVYSGLNTRVGLLDTPRLWWLLSAVIAVAVLGKGVACTFAARLGGESWRDAFAVGTLMNARGLMELILLNIGLERGIITPTFFTIMVLMAMATTLMASPLYALVSRKAPAPAG